MCLEETEIAIIGAGPSGLIAAREASRKGLKVTVLEEHGEIGLPCHCAGLLSIDGLSKIGAPSSGAYVLNMIRGARLYSPSNISITVEWEKPIAYVVDRYTFDKLLAEQALRSGSLIKLKSKVNGVKRDRSRWLLRINGEDKLRARLLIDAEGSLPKIPAIVGIKVHDAKRLLRAMQADILASSPDSEHVEVYFSRKLAPGLFAWAIPLNDEVTRVGLACTALDVRNRFIKFIRRQFNVSPQDKTKFLRQYSGLVITCGPIKKTFADGLLIVGDSAGQTKPITGGGVIFGGICAKIAGEVASNAIINNDFGERFLKKYEKEWKSRIGREIKISLLARKILNNLSDRDLDKIFSITVKEKIHKDLMSVEASMDYPINTLIKALGTRSLKFIPIIFRSLINSIIGKQQIYK